MRSFIAAFILTLLAINLAACAAPLTKREAGAGIGAVGGAAAGAAIGAAAGRSGLGALIGAGLGALGGAIIGDQLQKQDQIVEEQDKQIKQNQAVLEDLENKRKELLKDKESDVNY